MCGQTGKIENSWLVSYSAYTNFDKNNNKSHKTVNSSRLYKIFLKSSLSSIILTLRAKNYLRICHLKDKVVNQYTFVVLCEWICHAWWTFLLSLEDISWRIWYHLDNHEFAKHRTSEVAKVTCLDLLCHCKKIWTRVFFREDFWEMGYFNDKNLLFPQSNITCQNKISKCVLEKVSKYRRQLLCMAICHMPFQH